MQGEDSEQLLYIPVKTSRQTVFYPTLSQTFFFWTSLKHAFFPLLKLLLCHMHAGRCRSHLMYTGNIDAQMRSTLTIIVLHAVSFYLQSYCMTVEYSITFDESKSNASTFDLLRSRLPNCRRDHLVLHHTSPSNILRKCYNHIAPLLFLIQLYILYTVCAQQLLPTGLRQKHKAPGQVLRYCSAMQRSIYIALGTRFSSMQKNYAHVCNQAVQVHLRTLT